FARLAVGADSVTPQLAARRSSGWLRPSGLRPALARAAYPDLRKNAASLSGWNSGAPARAAGSAIRLLRQLCGQWLPAARQRVRPCAGGFAQRWKSPLVPALLWRARLALALVLMQNR